MVSAIDPAGQLLQEFPQPAWTSNAIYAMRVDEAGILWAETERLSEAPVIAGEPYSPVMVPLGTLSEVFDEGRQRASAVTGSMLYSGSTVVGIRPSPTGPVYICDQ